MDVMEEESIPYSVYIRSASLLGLASIINDRIGGEGR
jgi:hypothetical protein